MRLDLIDITLTIIRILIILLMKMNFDKLPVRKDESMVIESIDESEFYINLKIKKPQIIAHDITDRSGAMADDAARDAPISKFKVFMVLSVVIIVGFIVYAVINYRSNNSSLKDQYNNLYKNLYNNLTDLRASVNNTNSSSNLQILYDSLSAKLAIINASLYNLTDSNNNSNSNNSFSTNSSLQELSNDLMNVTASLALLKSYGFNGFSTMCENWNSTNFIKLNQNSCSGCYGNASNTQCSLCTGYVNGTTGINCTGCMISSGTNGFCNYCPICVPLTISALGCSQYLGNGNFGEKYLTLDRTSCSNCFYTNRSCSLCTDIMNSSKTAGSCKNCNFIGNGTGWCDFCSYCNF